MPLPLCPCGSNIAYEECCKLYHDGMKTPQDALLLMKSRYSAYALGKADYIINTTHPSNPSFQENKLKWREEIEDFSRKGQFLSLEIINFKEQDETNAEVTFKAKIKREEKDCSFKETSHFIREYGLWKYAMGEVDPL